MSRTSSSVVPGLKATSVEQMCWARAIMAVANFLCWVMLGVCYTSIIMVYRREAKPQTRGNIGMLFLVLSSTWGNSVVAEGKFDVFA
jgi:hypothetical protein